MISALASARDTVDVPSSCKFQNIIAIVCKADDNADKLDTRKQQENILISLNTVWISWWQIGGTCPLARADRLI